MNGRAPEVQLMFSFASACCQLHPPSFAAREALGKRLRNRTSLACGSLLNGKCEVKLKPMLRSLQRVILIASLCGAVPVEAQDEIVPDFTSANFGWLVSSGFDFLPVEGKLPPVGGPDTNWRGGIGLPANDFNYQPPGAAADPRRRGPARVGPWNIERLSNTDNPNLKAWAAEQMRMHNGLVSNGRRAFSAMSRCWPGGPAQDLFN